MLEGAHCVAQTTYLVQGCPLCVTSNLSTSLPERHQAIFFFLLFYIHNLFNFDNFVFTIASFVLFCADKILSALSKMWIVSFQEHLLEQQSLLYNAFGSCSLILFVVHDFYFFNGCTV